MCGICGVIFQGDAKTDTEQTITSMCNTLYHRGPDSQGHTVLPGAALGATRLAIIDVENGQQPLSCTEERFTVVFNGEIYNHSKLKHRLSSLGYSFKTNCDTESLLYAYKEFGQECLEQINGMFSFAIWDKKDKTLFAARDRTGIKPFYYTIVNGELVFGSELRTILQHPNVSRELDLLSVNQYLSFEYVPTPRTIFKNIKKLPPGHFLKFSNGNLEIRQYWDASFSQSESRAPVSWARYEKNLIDLLEESILKEMHSDVPIGVFLSGGIDSSCVAALMARQSDDKIQSFGVKLEDSSFDESRYAREVAKHVGTNHHEVSVSTEMICSLIEKIPEISDEPLADSSLIPTYYVSNYAKQHIKVALTGDGGDEIFLGYPTYQAHRMIEYYEKLLPKFIRANLIPGVISKLPVSTANISLDFKLRRFVGGRAQPVEVRHHGWLGAFTPEQKQELFNSWAHLEEVDTYKIAKEHYQSSDANLALNKLLYCDLKLYLEGDILVKSDRASMANSLEVRVPLLNKTLIEYVLSLPLNHKLRGLTTKYILKKSMKGILPPHIINRSKKGFNIPISRMLCSELKPLMLDLLSTERIEKRGLFNSNYIETLKNEHLSQKKDHRKLLWPLIVFELWSEKYC